MIDDRTLQRWLPAPVVALTGDLIRATLWMLLVVGLISCGRVYLRLALLAYERPGGNDFTIFYYTARMVSDCRPMYGQLPPEYALSWHGHFLGNLNPPQFQLLLAPLVPLGYRGAVVAWMLVNTAAVMLSGWLIVSELTKPLSARTALVTAVAVFASAAWTSVAVTGEVSGLLLLPFTAAWRSARRGDMGMAGVCLGVCASLKLFLLAFVVWFVIVRSWKGMAALAAGFMASMGLGVAVYGTVAFRQWVETLGRVAWWALPMNISLKGLTERVFNAQPPFVAVYPDAALVWPAWLLLALSVAALTTWRVWSLARHTAVDEAWAVLLLAALLVSPLGWIYYLPLATAPLLLMADGGRLPWRVGWVGGAFVLAVALLYVPMEVTVLGQPSRVATLVLLCLHSWAVLLLWGSLVASPVTTRSAVRA